MSMVWLITGNASGLGRNIAEAVLASGHRLVVADEAAAYVAAQVAVKEFGRLDVVVNNAEFGDFAPFEQLISERFKAVVDTNFYGVVNVTRTALPIMRKQKSGCILQISSVGARLSW